MGGFRIGAHIIFRVYVLTKPPLRMSKDNKTLPEYSRLPGDLYRKSVASNSRSQASKASPGGIFIFSDDAVQSSCPEWNTFIGMSRYVRLL